MEPKRMAQTKDDEMDQHRSDDLQDGDNNDAAQSRRALVSGAAGFALAASGLLLPAEDDGAAAREGAYGGELGRRRGKDRRGGDKRKRRDRSDKKGKGRRDGAPKDHGPFRATALTVVNRWLPSLECVFYYQIKTGLDDYDLPRADSERTILWNESFRYDPNRYRVGVLIKHTPGWQDYYADVRNVSLWFPQGGLSSGDHLNPAIGNIGGDNIPLQSFSVGEEHRDDYYTLKRKDDSADRIEVELVVRDPLG